jgi:hypothetical protein
MTPTTKRTASVLIGLAVLVISGLVHGFWGERWIPSTILQEAAARVDQVPLEIGDWNGQSVETDAGVFFQAGAQKYWTRTYVHARKKTAMLVILMCGRPGRMSVHTPEVCYRGAGYETAGKPERLTVQSELGEDLGNFRTARFSKQAGVASNLRLYWAWNAHGTWQNPDSPRNEFAGEPFLYKLYLSHDAPGVSNPSGVGSASGEAALDFLRQFLPVMRKTLFDPT